MTTIITEKMKENAVLLNSLIAAREENVKNPSKLNELKYNQEFKKALDQFHYMVDVHTNRYKKFANYQDLVQEANIGLIYALNNFDPQRSKNFFKIAHWYIKTKVKRSANKFDIINVPMKMGRESPMSRTNELPTMIDPLASCEEGMEKEQLIENIQTAMDCLNDMQRFVICSYYGINHQNWSYCESLSLTKIARKMNTSRIHVEEILNDAYRALSENENIINII